MKRISRRKALLAGIAAVALASPVWAETTVAYTTIRVTNMHCSACAQRIARRLYGVPGVVEVRADVPKNIAYVVPQKDKELSPRTLWEQVEAAGFKVARLDGPQGSFTAKPTR
jgi:copper chaperone CopZ